MYGYKAPFRLYWRVGVCINTPSQTIMDVLVWTYKAPSQSMWVGVCMEINFTPEMYGLAGACMEIPQASC